MDLLKRLQRWLLRRLARWLRRRYARRRICGVEIVAAIAPKWRANEAQWAMLFGRTAAALELIHDFDNLSYRRVHHHLPEIWVVETNNHVFSRKTGAGVLSLSRIRDEPTVVTAAGLVELAGYAILARRGIYRTRTNGDRLACALKRRALWFVRHVPDTDYYQRAYENFVRRRSGS